jgi:hypothetical protein
MTVPAKCCVPILDAHYSCGVRLLGEEMMRKTLARHLLTTQLTVQKSSHTRLEERAEKSGQEVEIRISLHKGLCPTFFLTDMSHTRPLCPSLFHKPCGISFQNIPCYLLVQNFRS